MTTNINLAEFEPTDEMKFRWPGISDKTKIAMVDRPIIEVPELRKNPPGPIMIESTGERVGGYEDAFSLIRLNLVEVGDHWCYYWEDSDTLFVQTDTKPFYPTSEMIARQPSKSAVGKIAIAKTSTGIIHGVGRVVAFFPTPTYKIERPDGTQFHWRINFCHIASEDCSECKGRGYILPEPVGDFDHDLTAVVCPKCAGEDG